MVHREEDFSFLMSSLFCWTWNMEHPNDKNTQAILSQESSTGMEGWSFSFPPPPVPWFYFDHPLQCCGVKCPRTTCKDSAPTISCGNHLVDITSNLGLNIASYTVQLPRRVINILINQHIQLSANTLMNFGLMYIFLFFWKNTCKRFLVFTIFIYSLLSKGTFYIAICCIVYIFQYHKIYSHDN